MTRPLGSFNSRVNLPRHQEDHQPVRESRVASLRQERIPEERGLNETGREKFVHSRGRQPVDRFAGQALNVDVKTGQNIQRSSGTQASVISQTIGAAEQRYQSA